MDVCLLDSEARCSKVSPAGFMIVGWGGKLGWGEQWITKRRIAYPFFLQACMHAHVNGVHKLVFETEVVKRFHTLAGSFEQCRHGVWFHLGPIGVVLRLPVWLWDRIEHLASWVPKARMTDTHVPLTTYPYRSLDSIYSMTLLALTHSHTLTLTLSLSLSLSHTHTHTHTPHASNTYMHTHTLPHSHR